MLVMIRLNEVINYTHYLNYVVIRTGNDYNFSFENLDNPNFTTENVERKNYFDWFDFDLKGSNNKMCGVLFLTNALHVLISRKGGYSNTNVGYWIGLTNTGGNYGPNINKITANKLFCFITKNNSAVLREIGYPNNEWPPHLPQIEDDNDNNDDIVI
jgi:hypothetical protein